MSTLESLSRTASAPAASAPRITVPALPGSRTLVRITNVRDPGNAGTVIRGADAAGADAVLLSDSSVDIYNPKVVRSTVGSLFHLPIVAGVPICLLLDRVRAAGLTLLAADGGGDEVLGDLDGDLLARP